MSKIKFVIEFPMKSAPPLLIWNYLSTPNGLGEWFADRVEKNNKEFIFYWNKNGVKAIQTAIRIGVHIRFKWLDEVDRSYFEMKITVSELTDETMLVITDFAEPDEQNEMIDLWTKQINNLKRILGC